tara:strand:+ start:6395 stop:16000 length:9606 start_codon:yes stop_codon:yes gene_type:complete
MVRKLTKTIYLAFFLISGIVFGQYSTEHYMPPFYYDGNYNDNPDEIRIDISTMETSSFDVSVKNYAGSTIYTKSISKTTPNNFSISYSSYLYADDVGTTDGTKGLYFTANKPFYLRVDLQAGSQTGSIASKGNAGMGQEFRSAHFYQTNVTYTQDATFGSFISIMATENSTTITITPNSGVYFLGRSNSSAWSVSLDKGRSYILGMDNSESSYDKDIIGTKITSDKDIVVNSGTWSGSIRQSQSKKPRDMGVDQLIPIDKTGTDYLILEGESGSYGGVHAIVVATENSTDVKVDGNTKISNLNAGEFYAWDLDNNNNSSLDYIETSKPALVYYQGYATDQNSVKNNHGLFVLAPIDASNTSNGYDHVHFGDDVDRLLSGSGEANFYVLAKNAPTVTYGSSNYSITSWDNQSTLSYSIDGNTWTLYRKLDLSIGYSDLYMTSSGPLYVWYGMGEGEKGLFSSIQPFSTGNASPIATAQTVTATEDVDKTITLSGTDSDGDNLSYTIVTLPSDGTLYQTSDGSTRGDAISSNGTTISDGSHRVIYVSEANGNGNSYGDFTFKVNDGTVDSEAAAVTVNVTAVNDAPTISSNPSVTTNEDVQYSFSLSNFNYSDVDDDALSLVKITDLESAGTFYLDADNDDNYDSGEDITDDQEITASNIASGHLRFSPVTNENGSSYTTFTFKVSDGSVYSSAGGTMTINVTAVDDAPTVANEITNVTVDEDASNTTIDLSSVFTDVDNNDNNISKSITGNSPSGKISGSISGNSLILDYQENKNGDVSITITGTSNGLTVTETFTVTINSVNDTPTANTQTVTVNEDTEVTITLSGSDDDGDDLSYKITTLPSNGTLYQTSDGSTKGSAISSTGTTVSDNSRRLIYISATNGNGNGHGNFAFKVNDGTVDSDAATVTVNVTAVNDAPTADTQTVTVNEDTEVTITLSGSDGDGDDLSYKISTLPSNGTLYQTSDGSTKGSAISSTPTTISDNNRRLIYISATNGNGNGHGNFGFKVNDGTSDSDEANVTVNVSTVDDAPTVSNGISDINANEDASNATIALNSVFSDVDNSDDDISKIVQANDNSDLVSVSISGNTLTIDYQENKNGTANITIRGTSNGVTIDDQFTITVNAVNDEPSFSKGSNISINEDAGAQTNNDWATSIDDGDPEVSQTVSFSVTNNNNSLFSSQPAINADGDLTFTSTSNDNGSATVTIVLADDGGTGNGGDDTYTSQTFTITVNAVNDAPTDIALSSTSVDDDSESGTTVGNLSSTDPDASDSHTYSIIGGNDASKFSIDGNVLKTAATIDYHTQQTYQVILRTTDNAGATYDETFTINASNPNNRQPVVTANQSFTIEENKSSGSDVGIVQGSDEDNETLQNWTLESGTNKDHFTINSSTGLLETAKKLDYEDSDERSYSLGIKVSDGNEFSSVVNVTVNVSSVNDMTPVVTSNQSFTINENISIGSLLDTLEATDNDVWPSGTSTTLQDWVITSGNSAGNFSLNSATGILTTASALDYETTNSYSLSVKVSDGSNLSSASTVTISINNINETPAASNLTKTTDEDNSLNITLEGTDPEGGSLTYKVTTLPVKGTISQSDGTAINSVNTTVTSNANQIIYIPNENFSGADSIKFTVKDSGNNESNAAKVAITVNSVNDKPSATSQIVTVNEDEDVTITLAGSDIDADDLTYIITALPSNGTLYQTSDGSTRGSSISSLPTTVLDVNHRLIYVSEENGNGNSHGDFSFKVNDGSLDSDAAGITVNVTAVDDAPVVKNQINDISTSEDAENYSINISTVFSDVDNEDTSILDSLVSNSDTSLVIVTISNDKINLDYKDNACGSSTIVIKGTSNGKSVNETFVVSVECEPDPPVASDSTLAIAEDSQIIYKLKWVDPDITSSFVQKVSSVKKTNVKKHLKSSVKRDRKRNKIKIPSSSKTLQKTNNVPSGISLKIQSLPVYGTLKQGDSTAITTTPTIVTSSGDIVIYQPNENYVGADTFKYNAIDQDDLVSGLGVITIKISGVNDPPTVVSINDTINEDQSKKFVLSGKDEEESDITLAITDLPNNGAIYKANGSLISSAPTTLDSNLITYIPKTDFFGIDTLIFKASDGISTSDEGLITILVKSINDPPIALSDTVELEEDSSTLFSVSGSDVETESLIYQIGTLQTIGKIFQTSDGVTKGAEIVSGDTIINSQQKIMFEAQENAYGIDSLIFKVSDGELLDSASIVFIVSSKPDNPIAENAEIVIAQGLEWDYDLSNKISDPDLNLNVNSLSIVSSNGGGEYRVPTDTTFLIVFDYTSNLSYTGTDTVVYQICDDTELCDTGTISISVITGRKPLAIADTLNLIEDAEPTFFNVLQNDSDLDEDLDISSLEIISSFVGSFDDSGNEAKAQQDSTLLISMASNFYGKDSLIYRISDQTRLSSEARVFVFVNPSPDPPEVTDPQTVYLEEGSPVDLVLYATDADGDTLTYTLCQEPSSGILTQFSNSDTLSEGDVLLVSSIESPSITIFPDNGFYGEDIFKYCVEDEDGNIAEARVVISVVNIPEPPVAIVDSIEILQGNTGIMNVLSNDTDPEDNIDASTLLIFGKEENVSFKTMPTYAGGIATVSDSIISFDYSHLFMFTGKDSIHYSICDEEKSCDSTNVYINIFQDDIPPGILNVNADKDTLFIDGNNSTISRSISAVTDLVISATVKDSLPLESVILNIGKGGSQNYTSYQIPFEEGSRILEAEQKVVLETIDEKGIKFFFNASDILGYNSNSVVKSLPVKIPPGTIQFPDCFPKNTWLLISIPTQLDKNTIQDVFYDSFGEINKSKFVIWEYSNGEYLEPTQISPGISYWVYQKIGEECEFTLGSGVVTDIDTLEWVLKPGWNMVGNPYPFSFSMGDVDQTLFCGPLEYSDNSGWSDYKTTIDPFGGYIICNKSDTTVVLTATGENSNQLNRIFSHSNRKKQSENKDHLEKINGQSLFRVKISFNTTQYSDNNNYIGIHPLAKEQFDRFDNITEPPVPNDNEKIKFDWVMDFDLDQQRYLLQDIKFAGDSTFTWNGYLHPNVNKEKIFGSVFLEGETNINYKMIMVDRSNGEKFNILQKLNFNLREGNTSTLGRKFSVFYGPSSWVDFQVDELISSIPTDYILGQNYPNPFNPVTSINYQIPTDQRVKLSIYNILGQEVITLVNKEQFAGKYTVRWNGVTDQFTEVSSGTYFYVLQTSNFRQVKKMALLK